KSHAKQGGPRDRKYRFFADIDAATESNEPAKFRNERTVEGGNGLAQLAADKAFASTREQIVPVTLEKQRIHHHLHAQADPQNGDPRVGFCWKQKNHQLLTPSL